MGIRKYKPTTPGRRGASVADFVEITRDEPEKSLVRPLHSKGGRNVHGRVTARHQGGGHKRAYRVIDFKRADKDARTGQAVRGAGEAMPSDQEQPSGAVSPETGAPGNSPNNTQAPSYPQSPNQQESTTPTAPNTTP